MKYYELLYIIPAKFTEIEVAEIIKKVEELLTKHGARVKRHEDAGKIRFAYPISNIRFGNYVLAEFEAEPSAPKLIERGLRLGLAEEVLRFTLQTMLAISRGKPLQLTPYIAPLSEEAVESARERDNQKKYRPVNVSATAPSNAAVQNEDLDKKIEEALLEDAAKL